MYEVYVTCEGCGEKFYAMANEPEVVDSGWWHDECYETSTAPKVFTPGTKVLFDGCLTGTVLRQLPKEEALALRDSEEAYEIQWDSESRDPEMCDDNGISVEVSDFLDEVSNG